MDKRLQKLFAKYNARYWNDKLPPTVIMWEELKENTKHVTLGLTRAFSDGHFSIAIHPKLKDVGWQMVKLTLLHEMAHVALYPNFTHGRKFQMELRRLAAEGAFDKLI